MPDLNTTRPAPGQLVTCRAPECRALIRFYSTVGGKWIPLDERPHEFGTVVLERRGPGLVARILTGTELPAQREAYRPHWQTCPASPEFRRRTARTGPRCHVCREPMPADLARREHWTTHPCCDPAEARILARWNNLLAREASSQGRNRT